MCLRLSSASVYIEGSCVELLETDQLEKELFMNPLLTLIAEVLTLHYTTKIGEKAAKSIGEISKSDNDKLKGDINSTPPGGRVKSNGDEVENVI